MKNLFERLFVTLILVLSFTGCYTLGKSYYYKGKPIDYSLEKYYEFREYMYIECSVKEEWNKNSPVLYVELQPKNTANVKKSKKVEILSDKVNIVYEGKEYVINVSKSKTTIFPYRNGINITGEFIVYFGKVRIDDKKIIEMPPLKFNEYIKVDSYSPILDGLNIDTVEKVYNGPLEEYKGK